jgi:cytochrome d ubiquinol oxidase subunit II
MAPAWHGLEVLGQCCLDAGVVRVVLSRVLALLVFCRFGGGCQVVARARSAWGGGRLFLLFFCAFLLLLCLRDGLAEDSVTGQVVQLPYRYLVTLVELPLLGVFLLLGVLLWLFGWVRALSGRSGGAFWLCFGGAFLAVLALLLAAGWNGNYYLPSVAEMQDSLSISNSLQPLYS